MLQILNGAFKNIFQEHWRSILSGTFIGIVLAPFQVTYWVVLIVLIPFLEDISRSRSLGDSLAKGYWFGLFSAFSALNWIAFNTIAGYIAVLALHPWTYVLYSVFFYILWQRMGEKAIFPGAMLWIALEMARSWGQLRFPWINLYTALSYDLEFIQVIEYTGPLFLSFFIITSNIVFWFMIRYWINFKKIHLKSVVIIVIGIFIYIFLSYQGAIRIKEIHNVKTPVIKSGIVQPDIDAYLKFLEKYKQLAYDRLFAYSDSLAKEEVQLIVWPETALPTYVRNNAGVFIRVQDWVSLNQLPVITGIPDFELRRGKYYSYNAIWLIHPDSVTMDVYYKHFLVPGGETIPFKNYIPLLENINVGGGNFWPGKKLRTLNREYELPMGEYKNGKWQEMQTDLNLYTLDLKVIPAVCYESIFPELIRYQKFNNSGNMLVVITNDGWYGRTAGPYQHLRASVFRAIETRISVIRSANNGISGFIDPTGEIYEETILFSHDYRSSYLPVMDIATFYEKYGNLWVWILMGIALIRIAYHEIFKHVNISKVDIKGND